jgi:class 3 adenylate cyclase
MTADAQRDIQAGLISASAENDDHAVSKVGRVEQGNAALVFTDPVGSTSLQNQIGNERMADLRRVHFLRAERLIRESHGYEIKRIGDSVMALLEPLSMR